jgi:drug/metabolite transporter (DMT)-like permease
MSHSIGIIFAFVALLGWGFGDFFIQKSTRLLGSSWKSLFLIGMIGLIVLFPFVRNEIFILDAGELVLLGALGVVILFTALFDFEALRRGKIAIVEPVMSIELPLTVALSVTLANETLSWVQIILIAMVFAGIMLAVTFTNIHKRLGKGVLERGVIFAGIGAVGLALVSFLTGISSQRISPLMAIWFSNLVFTLICLVYILAKGQFRGMIEGLKKHPAPILAMSIFDNSAWVAYAFATTYIPISIAITISEGYVALAALLGLFVNREKLKPHQKLGVALTIVGVLALSYFSE